MPIFMHPIGEKTLQLYIYILNLNSMKKFSIFILICALFCSCASEGSYTVTSPNGRVAAEISVGNGTTYSVTFDAKSVLCPSNVALRLEDGTILGSGKVKRVKQYSKSETIETKFYFRDVVADCYNALTVEFADRSALEFRVYDDGKSNRDR